MDGLKYLAFLCLICLTVIVGLDHGKVNTVVAAEDISGEKTESLPTVDSFENLKKSLEDAQPIMATTRMADGVNGALMQKAAEAPAVPSAAADSAADYSQTNVQVQGVDEGDMVKTDGKYIYKINSQKIIVAQVHPVQEMKVVSTLHFDQEMAPVEIYVDNQYLTVILNKNTYPIWKTYPADSGDNIQEKRIMPPDRPFENSTKVLVYDLKDPSNLKLVREVEIDGAYLSSRKIGNHLYLVNNKYIQVYLLKEQPELVTTPGYKDSADGGELKRIPYEDIYYFPGSTEANYLIVAGIDLETMTDKKIEVKTYLGSGQNIYSSLENLYVAVPAYKYEPVQPFPQATEPINGSLVRPSIGIMPMPVEINTNIYKFALKEGNTKYLGKGRVSGNILNQFSMDEHEGYFRIATTVQKYTGNGVNMTNHLFILDQGMNVAGKIENIAPEEKIYSVRFIGNRGYMVTFKTVDPLFVLDLKDPKNPGILGELKIPGYSNYLHPYDENHIIGFGKEAVEVEESHWSGQGTVKNAYYLGMKIALFDVSDVKNPKEKFKVEIGDRGTDSELFWNHKALLFNKDKDLLAFPVTVCDIDPATIDKNDYLAQKDPRLAYGQPVFQGAFAYRLSPDKGFELKGMITHQPSGKIIDLQRTGQYDYNRDISRSLYIDNTLYTISNGYLKANDLDTLDEQGGIELPQ